ncbi:hypothetical protein BS78_06G190100 [Paspalum vaginatum]|nr:hypothetical protein BS78_06G190100 [Paspalum vaginatum]
MAGTLLRRLLCCSGTRRHQGKPRQRHDGIDDAKSFLGATCPPSGASPRPRRRRWLRLRGANRVFARSASPSGTTARVVERPSPATDHAAAATAVRAEEDDGAANQELSGREHAAAATIQAHFRGHLARQAFRALRSLVKLQAFARGAYVRKQAIVAIRCMKVLVRLQVRVRSRQLLLPSRHDQGDGVA